MTKDEVLKLALKTLEYAGPSWIDARQPAITAIKEALAEPEQAPVVFWDGESRFVSQKTKEWDKRTGGTLGFGCDIALYTTPPQRKPLSDEEIETYRHMIDWTAHWSYINFARAIEAAHGIKE